MAAAPGDEVVPRRLKGVLRFGVESVQPLAEAAWNVALRVVEINLRLHAVFACQRAGHAAKKIAARERDVVADRLLDRAAIDIALQREAARRAAPARTVLSRSKNLP